VVIALGAAALPATATASQTTGSATAQSPANPRLQALLDELVAAGAPGVLAMVDDGQHTWRLSSGAGRLDPRQPLWPGARFRVGSITKTFVATVVLQLVQEGRLRLDDSVERWLPGLVPNGRRMSVAMLLNHTSGIFNYTPTTRRSSRT
jgi:D-alanyl-D-alanine carboxypeptidase